MALKPCKECGQQVSTKAKACPHCGTPNPTAGIMQTRLGCGHLLLILLVGFVAMVVLAPDPTTSGPTTSGSSGASTPQLDAQVRKTDTQVFVTNNDSFAWTDCSIELNAGILSGGWSQEVGQVGPGEVISGGLMAFTRGGGERFNPATHVVESVDIFCDTPSGRGFYSGAF